MELFNTFYEWLRLFRFRRKPMLPILAGLFMFMSLLQLSVLTTRRTATGCTQTRRGRRWSYSDSMEVDATLHDDELLTSDAPLLLRSSFHAARSPTTLCIGVPLRDEATVADTRFLDALQVNAFDGRIGHSRVVFYVTTRGQHLLDSAVNVSRHFVRYDGGKAGTPLRFNGAVDVLRPTALASNATLGMMINQLLVPFTSNGNSGSGAERCSHILLLDPLLTPVGDSFVHTMVKDIKGSDAVAATCTTHWHHHNNSSSSTEASQNQTEYFVVVDRGLNVTLNEKNSASSTTPSSSSPHAVVTRNDFGVVRTRLDDHDTHREKEGHRAVHVFSPYCVLIDWAEIRKRSAAVATQQAPEGERKERKRQRVGLQVSAVVAAEGTVVDVLLHRASELFEISDVLTQWTELLAAQLARLTPKEMRELEDVHRRTVRKAFKTSLDAQQVVASITASSSNVHKRSSSLVTNQQQLLWNSCGNAHPSTTTTVESIHCVAVKAQEQMKLWHDTLSQQAVEEIPLFVPPEDHVGWSLSMAIYKLLFRSNVTMTSPAAPPLVASSAPCVINDNPTGLLTASQVGHRDLLQRSSFPLTSRDIFWSEHKTALERVLPALFHRQV
ncbi:membrane-associated protein, putative [Bodo saltans]|uniref:Membrane-associated protein, putative n=1 Tax=Bodo saltans TaxID=75058 RepID=A0A0S4JBP5_BODSA|nr:membrane-associated protein, putative [Bodo saltans]|eukprot:CUG87687.1 membrane-associated protein, putative [Bodo saltans]